MNKQEPFISSFSYQWMYDVFISFRGEDTRYGFTGNLYNALCRKGIHTFMDDEELKKGDEITPSLHKAIRQSRMAIIIFSENYASSTFCLDELVNILQCIKGELRLVWPIFYNIEPSVVRHQKGSYEKALTMHKENLKADEDKIQKWKAALQEASNISGIHFNLGHEYEYQFIERIVKEISRKINRVPLHVANYAVGLPTRVMKICSLLKDSLDDKVNSVGICGIGGLGKTTVARALYNLIADQFEGLCFLHDIKEESRKYGIVKLQEMMLSEILGEDIKVGDANKGIPIIKRRLIQKKVLLILDNVDKQEQLDKLAGGYDWFGCGSKIIITTRDRHLLVRHGVQRKRIYEVEKFNEKESFELLSWNAFKGREVDLGYMEVLSYVIQYTKGLPLALEVIGSHLFGKSIDEWKSAIDIYKKIPNEDVQQILKVSYDGLKEVEKEVFLDIACFYKRKELKYVKDLGEYAHGFDPSYCIGVLIDKCLISIDHTERIEMHDLIQDMGREIIRQESPKESGERSRLWYHEDVIDVLENDTGTGKVLIIVLEYLPEAIKVHWNGKAFKKMKNLKVLILRKTYFSKAPKYLPNSLRVLQWEGYPGSCLPANFNPKKLVVLNLPNSCLQSLGPVKRLENVTVLKLSGCKLITRVPDISGISNLTNFKVDDCENLIEIHESIGYLKKLKTLSALHCENLKTFPHSINLPSLQYLGLSGCLSLEKFPEILEEMRYIKRLDLSDTNLQVPLSIRNLVSLGEIVVRKGYGLNLSNGIAMLPELKYVDTEGCEVLEAPEQVKDQGEVNSMLIPCVKKITLQACDILDELLPICLAWFANVKFLNLSGNNFTVLPACINKCHFLEQLYLDDCKHLGEIKGIPPNIKELWARNCTLLSSESRSMLMSKELHDKSGDRKFVLPGSAIPEWFDHHSRSPSISFWFRNKFPEISLCSVLHSTNGVGYDGLNAILVINGEKTKVSKTITMWTENQPHQFDKDHILFIDVSEWRFSNHYIADSICEENGWDRAPLVCEWNHVEIVILGQYDCLDYPERGHNLSKDMGISWVKKEEIKKEDIRFTNPYKRTKLSNDLNWGLRFLTSTWTSGTLCDKDTRSQEGGTHARDQSVKFMSKRKEQYYFTTKSELKFEIAKVAYRGELVDYEGAERFIQLMRRLSGDSVSDLHARTMLLKVLISYRKFTYYSILIKGLPLLDKWLHDVLNGKFGDIESDESVLRFLRASLEVLQVLPVSLNELRTCNNVWKTVYHLRRNKQPFGHIWKLATEVSHGWEFVNKCSINHELQSSEVPDDLAVAMAKNSHLIVKF